MKDNGKKEDVVDNISATDATSSRSLTIDYALYERYLEDSDLTDAQKNEFLDTLWKIIVGFVDLGFGVHPLQQVCEQKEIDEEILTRCASTVVEGSIQPKNKFNIKTDNQIHLTQERSHE